MANLIETATYDDAVPQLETNTIAIGGPGGVMNAQAQALANRTKFIKEKLDSPSALAALVQDASESTKGKVQLASTTPAALGTAAKGSATTVAKADHVHQMPTLDEVGEGTTYKRVTAAEKTLLAGATATPTANAIPKADGSGKLDTWISDATTSAKGKVQLATSAELEAGTDTAKALTPAVVRPATIKRTKMPDGATAVYSQDAWATTDGWSYSSGTISLLAGGIRFTIDGSGSFAIIKDALSQSIGGKVLYIELLKSSNLPNDFRIYGRNNGSYQDFIFIHNTITTQKALYKILLPVHWGNGIALYGSSAVNGAYFEVYRIRIGEYSYLDGTLIDTAASDANIIGDTTALGAYGSGTITSNGTNVSDGNTVTIHGKVYTFKSTLTPTEGEVLIGADAQTSLANLAAAINRTDPGTYDGVIYKVAAAHPLVSASANSLTLTVTALQTGELGNQIMLEKSAATLTLSSSTLTGGYSATAKKLATLAAPIIAGNGTRPAAALIELTDTTKIGYEHAVDVASGGTVTLPSGGTWIWVVYGYGATINSAKKGSSAGGTTLTVSGANATVWYRRYA